MSKRLAALFRGLDRAYGVSRPTDRRSDRGKAESRYTTRQGTITPEDWQRHLAGEAGLVVHPLRDDGTVLFGAIDVDVYPLDLPELAAKIAELGLPLVTCRTKSGGAHLYLFLSEPCDAREVQETLMGWAVALGYPRVEIFPKQISLASDDDVGNGINVPYYDAEKTTRYAVAPDGKALDLDAFLSVAEAARTDPATLADRTVAPPDLLEGAPPCLQHWARAGIAEGQRNEVMFDFAVYAKKRWPDDWPMQFEDLNRRYCEPPLPHTEVGAIVKSVRSKKDYLYKSKCEGPYCQPHICRRTEHGKGGGYDDPGVVIDGMTVVLTEPKTFIVSVNGRRIEMESGHLMDQRKFRHEVYEKLLLTMKPVKPARWQKIVDDATNQAEKIEAPEDAGPRGQLEYHIREFFDRSAGRDIEQLTLNRCWTDREMDRTYFRSPDFIAYLKKNRVTGWRERDVYNLVRALGGGDERLVIRGGQVRCWWVPAPEEKLGDLSDVDTSPKDDAPF